MTNEFTEELAELVKQATEDIIHDYTDEELGSYEMHELSADCDDGVTFSEYKILVNNKWSIHVKATGYYAGEQDCFSWSSESHYTKSVQYESLEDFEYEIVKVEKIETLVDKSIANDIEASKELSHE